MHVHTAQHVHLRSTRTIPAIYCVTYETSDTHTHTHTHTHTLSLCRISYPLGMLPYSGMLTMWVNPPGAHGSSISQCRRITRPTSRSFVASPPRVVTVSNRQHQLRLQHTWRSIDLRRSAIRLGHRRRATRRPSPATRL